MNIYRKAKELIFRGFFKNARLSFAQSGEDMILATILCQVKKGFYVDIGANNPYIQSNTHFFYKNGWRGINIDVLPNSMKTFKKIRKNDINLEIAISDKEEHLQYFMFSSSFYNTFSSEAVEETKKVSEFIGVQKLRTQKLSDIFGNYNVKEIDFMSVDVEGYDLQVLKSNNWNKYRPKIIITEYYAKELNNIKNDEIYKLMDANGYIYFCNTPTNVFYIEHNYFITRYENNSKKELHI